MTQRKEQRRRGGPKGGVSNPRIAEARRLRANGKTDEDLLGLGFTRNELTRSFVPNSVSHHKRCRVCGWKSVVNEDRVCMACELVAKIKREGMQEPEPYVPVKKGRPPAVKPNMKHPAILKPGK